MLNFNADDITPPIELMAYISHIGLLCNPTRAMSSWLYGVIERQTDPGRIKGYLCRRRKDTWQGCNKIFCQFFEKGPMKLNIFCPWGADPKFFHIDPLLRQIDRHIRTHSRCLSYLCGTKIHNVRFQPRWKRKLILSSLEVAVGIK